MSAAPVRGADKAVGQYLNRYARPEVRLCDQLAACYERALVVQAFREAPDVLAGFESALAAARGLTLVIVVVNARRSLAERHRVVHEQLLDALRGPSARPLDADESAVLSRRDGYHVLSLDRALPGRAQPDTDGVGLARRIGCDLSLALHRTGRLRSPWIFNTDADARLPVDYFSKLDGLDLQGVGAVVHPFWHEPGGDAEIDEATALYELRLRYYVAGLERARSPYAFHSVGSTLTVHAVHYARVRGFPRRLAGEDFYLLNKLAKVSSICLSSGCPISLRSRASERTPHGTGSAAARLAELPRLDDALFYNPLVFEALGVWLAAVTEFARSADVEGARRAVAGGGGEGAARVLACLGDLGAFEALERARAQFRDPSRRLASVHTWFDGFRTLKLVHALRDAGLASVPYRAALDVSWCADPGSREERVGEGGAGEPPDVGALRRRLARRELRGRRRLGAPFQFG